MAIRSCVAVSTGVPEAQWRRIHLPMQHIPGLGRPPGEEMEPTPVFCLENPTDRGAWWATVHGVRKSQTRLGD